MTTDRNGKELTPGCKVVIVRPSGKREPGWTYHAPIGDHGAYLERPRGKRVQWSMCNRDRLERQRERKARTVN